MLQHADLEIRVLKLEPNGYPVELTLKKEREFPRGYLSAEIPDCKFPIVDPDETSQKLHDWFFEDDKVKTAWAEARGLEPRRRIRLRIDDEAPELHTLPWELLAERSENGKLQVMASAAAMPFSRYLAGQWNPGSPVFKRPLKILVAIANPQNLKSFGLNPVDVNAEWAVLQEALKNLEAAPTLLPPPVTLEAIETHLRQGYHVLHFVGHGAYDKNKGAVLYLEDNDSQVRLVYDKEFAEMLARQLGGSQLSAEERLRLVFLGSCQTATRSAFDAFRGFAPQLVAAGAPAVVAMQDLVQVDTEREFGRAFYKELLNHGQVDLASNQARSFLLSAKLPEAAVPVLFSRLRDCQLLGQRGRISSDKESIFWPFLLENIEARQCTPFLGPGMNAGLLQERELVAEALADDVGYPLPDRRNLARVAQFVDSFDAGSLHRRYQHLMRRSLLRQLEIQPTEEQKRRFSKATFTEMVEALNWSERVQATQENEPHHLLAELGLPLYVTTNFDNFMYQALKHKKYAPRRVGPRWERTGAGELQYALTPEPSPDQPVVLHLNGYDGDPEQFNQLVLTEDDIMAQFVRLSRDQLEILPANLIGMLSQQSFLFLGYSLDDWEFRLILQGLIRPIAQTHQASKLHVGVQFTVEQAPSQERAMEYLGRYLGRFNIDIYWGTTQQFISELHSRWQEHQERASNDW